MLFSLPDIFKLIPKEAPELGTLPKMAKSGRISIVKCPDSHFIALFEESHIASPPC